MKEHATDRDFDFFKTYEAVHLNYPKNEEEEEQIKWYQMPIVIAGQLFGDLKRNNDNLVSRSLLFIDFDDVKDTENVFLQKIADKLKDVNHCLYPTLKYKPDNIRYRLVIELDRNVNADEYEKLLFGLCHELDVTFEFDISNKTWSQGQGLPVKTRYSREIEPIIHDGYQAIPVDAFLFKITNSKEWKDATKQQRKAYNSGQFTTNFGGERKYTGKFLEDLFNGENEGNRNNWWRKKVDSMLAVDTPMETIYLIMDTLNNTPNIFPSPLSKTELKQILVSRCKNHVKKGGVVY